MSILDYFTTFVSIYSRACNSDVVVFSFNSLSSLGLPNVFFFNYVPLYLFHLIKSRTIFMQARNCQIEYESGYLKYRFRPLPKSEHLISIGFGVDQNRRWVIVIGRLESGYQINNNFHCFFFLFDQFGVIYISTEIFFISSTQIERGTLLSRPL